MRFMPAILAKLFKPAPMQAAESDDSIGRELDEAVEAHSRKAADARASIDNLRGALNDVLVRLEPRR